MRHWYNCGACGRPTIWHGMEQHVRAKHPRQATELVERYNETIRQELLETPEYQAMAALEECITGHPFLPDGAETL